ncbi:FadR/GntR family transcriptional regulator [Terracidiphilus sp.]|jgi:GntR family transcriptional repressor for pyruvate dehydrogenase complex|uniref:FadR/GntR family transcriptional regulator n=1 Tax=Terracidiphilus sp. TaxID=1964191 RepID=UPI003C151C08
MVKPRIPGSSSPKNRVTASLISEIKGMIASGALGPGSRLPAERDLAKQFHVNRASVRQVFKVLEMMGVLTQRVGDGTYLSTSAEAILNEPLDFLVLLDDLSHHELFETRLIVEPELAARAAERATTEDLHALRTAVTEMQNSTNTEERLAADMAFHDAIFRASGNRICQLLFKRIHRTLLSSMGHLSNRVSLDQPLSFHKRIYAAVRGHDAEAARQAMREHILDARSLLSLKSPAKNAR